MTKGLFWALTALFIAGGALLLGDISIPPEVYAGSVLKKGDCIKCHADIFDELDEGKSKHKWRLSCVDCHKGQHPPEAPKGALIPECSQCHKDTPHFELAGCTGCHRNPHQPRTVVFEGGQGQKPACKTCHPDQVKEVNSHPTSHTGFACSFCHKEHRDRPDCLSCHEAHVEGQVFEDCIKCHQAHQPLTLTYGTHITNSECGACHLDIQESLEASKAKHAEFKCIFCHADRHAVIPSCEQCHKKPHDKKMIQNFASCNDCHQSAHDILF